MEETQINPPTNKILTIPALNLHTISAENDKQNYLKSQNSIDKSTLSNVNPLVCGATLDSLES